MGSRAVALVCRTGDVARRRFRAPGNLPGMLHTRTGRRFFDDDATTALLDAVTDAVTAAGLWDHLDTDWILVDCELLPWSAKAEGLLRSHYAAVGAAGQ
mgnify:CR=1 FL=1